MKGSRIDRDDERWGGYIPWFLRHEDFAGSGDFLLFFGRLSHRSFQLLAHNEVGIPNLPHFASRLESKSHQRYRFTYEPEYDLQSVAHSVEKYFNPETLKVEMKDEIFKKQQRRFRSVVRTKGLNLAHKKIELIAQKRGQSYYRPLFIERLGILEAMLKILPKEPSGFSDFVQDIRSYFAEAGIMLDISQNNYDLELLEEPLLQKEVIEKLLPRLELKFPQRADELVRAYHDMLNGKEFDEIFISAFKTLEEIARSITNDKKFEFKSAFLNKYFPKMHKTIYATIENLNAHRGDEGGHARATPEAFEMRYLLFSICNVALLLLDYE